MMIRYSALFAFALLATSQVCFASETVQYIYDAKGRLVKVIRTGSAHQNATVTTDYEVDRADNRKKVKTTGAPIS